MLKTICLPVTTATCTLIVRSTSTRGPVMWPLLVVRPCPYSKPFEISHGHAHAICDHWPGGRWVKLAPCNRRPYVLSIEQPEPQRELAPAPRPVFQYTPPDPGDPDWGDPAHWQPFSACCCTCGIITFTRAPSGLPRHPTCKAAAR